MNHYIVFLLFILNISLGYSVENKECSEVKVNGFSELDLYKVVTIRGRTGWLNLVQTCNPEDYSLFKKALNGEKLTDRDLAKITRDLCNTDEKIDINNNEYCEPGQAFECPVCALETRSKLELSDKEISNNYEEKKKNRLSLLSDRKKLIDKIFSRGEYKYYN